MRCARWWRSEPWAGRASEPAHGAWAARLEPGKALARAHRWQRMLDEGRYACISEMAAVERLDRGYLGRILQLTLLAPDIVEAILDGRQPPELGLPGLMEPLPAEWSEQGQALLNTRPAFRCVHDQRPAGGRCAEKR